MRWVNTLSLGLLFSLGEIAVTEAGLQDRIHLAVFERQPRRLHVVEEANHDAVGLRQAGQEEVGVLFQRDRLPRLELGDLVRPGTRSPSCSPDWSGSGRSSRHVLA